MRILRLLTFYGGAPDNRATISRLDGFRGTLKEHGFPCIECPLPNPTPEQRASHSHRPALIRWLHELPKPVGIMAFDDTVAHDLALLVRRQRKA